MMLLERINQGDVNNPGTLVRDLIASAAGDRITDEDGDPEGIAVIAADVTHGAWEFTTDGTTWQALGQVSETTARLLATNDTTRIRFVPQFDYRGTLGPAVTFRAWDRTIGVSGTVPTLSTPALVLVSERKTRPSLSRSAMQ
jgi:hypothetical protein